MWNGRNSKISHFEKSLFRVFRQLIQKMLMISCQISIWMILTKIFAIDIMCPGIVLVPPSVCHLWLKVGWGSFQSLMVTWHALKVAEYVKKCLTIRFIRIIHAQIYKPSSWVDILRHFQLKNSFSTETVFKLKLKLCFTWKCLWISTHELGL